MDLKKKFHIIACGLLSSIDLTKCRLVSPPPPPLFSPPVRTSETTRISRPEGFSMHNIKNQPTPERVMVEPDVTGIL